MGLLLKGQHFRRQFCRRAELWEINELPALELRAVTEIEVLSESIVLPAARVVDGGAPPHAGGPIEVHEPARSIARRVLDDEMPVQENRLRFGEQRRIAVEMIPAHLHH